MKGDNTYKAKKRLDYKKPDFTATDIDLTFQLADEVTVVKATTHFVRLTTDKKAPLRLDGEELILNECLLNGQQCKYTTTDTELIVPEVPDDFELYTECVIAPVRNTSLMGLYKSNGCFCTQCEPEGFRKITYFLDRPDVLAKYRVTVIGPEYGCGVLLSNGNLIDSGEKDGRNYAVWEDPFPKPSYLFALVAGTFDIIHDTFITKSGRKVDLSLYVDRGAESRGLWAMQSIKDSMAWDEQRFNLEYDLDNFKVVAVDFFNFGAMENKSLNIFNSSFVLVDPETATDTNYYNVQGVIGHEYFHNWTGDRVTLRDWFQLSLKESLTVFRDQEFSSDVNSRILTRLDAINLIRSTQFAEDAGPMAHPVRPEQVMEMNNFYTVTIYDKGAEVIRMIHTILGEELFQKGVAAYLERFDGSAATIEDFILTMETAAMTDLSQFRRWYSQAGTPNVYAKWNMQDGKFVLTLSQTTAPTPGQKNKEPFFIPVRTSFMNKLGQTVVPPELPENGVLILKEAEQSYEFTTLDESVIPVVFRDFSAPIKLKSIYTTEDYLNMLQHCDDPFIKVDSLHSLINQYVHKHIDKVKQNGELPEPIEIIEGIAFVLQDKTLDEQLKAVLISVPSIRQMMETFKKIDLDSLQIIHDKLEGFIANALLDRFTAEEKSTRTNKRYVYNPESAARRAYHEKCMHMVVAGFDACDEVQAADDLIMNAYIESNNMTDRLAALTQAVHYDLPCKDDLLERFAKSYSKDPLTFDKFFAVQASVASEDTVNVVRKLLDHPCFDITNPNRVRALMGTFGYANPIALHRKDGTGYLLMLDVIRKLHKINPSVAARILDGMINYHRLDSNRIAMAEDYLNKIKNIPDLARSVYEKVTAALEKE